MNDRQSKIYRRVLSYYRAFTRATVAGILFTIIGIAFSLLRPWPLKLIVDYVLRHRPIPWLHLPERQAILLLCLSLVVVQLLWGVCNLASNYIFVRAGLQALLRLRTELYSHLQRLSLKFHDARRSSDSSFRVAYDSQSIQTIYNKGFTGVFSSVITLIGTFVVMLRLDWELTLLSLAIVPLLIAAIYFYALRIRRQSTTIQEQDSAMLAQAQEGLSSIRMVHAFGREDWEVSQFRDQAHGSLKANLRLNMTNVQSALVISTIVAVGTAAMYYLGTLHVLAGTLSLGSLLLFSAYLTMLYQPLEALTYTAWAMEGATAGARRCFEVLDRRDDVNDAPGAIHLKKTEGAIAFDEVSFRYRADRPVLEGVNLKIAPHQVVALVGGTGAGKSTMLSLVPRFYDPTAGRVTLDGRDLRTLAKQSLRAQIAIVLQDTLLFSTTVRENIAYGRPDASEAEIHEAARQAEADGFIREMPDGYESVVGERGGHLSVGQRQRIGIARAFLKNAPILLLDEPTSALDPTTEASIMHVIKNLMKDRTTLIVTHRIATIHGVDQIVVLEHGRIVEEGRGSELLDRGGVYARLHSSGNFGDE